MKKLVSRKEAESMVADYITFSNVVGQSDFVQFRDGSFGTVTWLDSDGEEVLVEVFEN